MTQNSLFILQKQMSIVKYTEKQLKMTINTERIGDRILHYSVCDKQATLISIISKERLLIFDESLGQIFYVNDIKSVPFISEKNIPKPKNDVAYISLAVIKAIPKTQILCIQFNKKNQKQQTVTSEWNFKMANARLARQWVQLIKDVRNKKTAEALGLGDNKEGAEIINDTLAFGLLPQKKEENNSEKEQNNKMASFFMGFQQTQQDKKKQKQILESNKKQQPVFNLTTSKHESPKNSQFIKQGSLKNSNIKISDLQQSRVSQSGIRHNDTLNNRDVQQEDMRYSKSIYAGDKQRASNIISIPENQFKKSRLGTMGKSERLDDRQQRENKSDWNRTFMKNYNEKTILEFRKQALETFNSLELNQLDLEQNEPIKTISKNGLQLSVAKVLSCEAIILKNQFKNYHYLLQKFQKSKIINVPLCCIIQYLGWVCLVKAPLSSRKLKLDSRHEQFLLKKIESQTKISKSIWSINGEFWDMTQTYGELQNRQPTIYVDELRHYLPSQSQEIKSVIRPEVLLNAKENIQFDHKNTSKYLQFKKDESIQIISNLLSDHEVVICHYNQLKQFMHTFGLNISCLPQLHIKLKDRQAKKIVHSILTAKLIRDQIKQTFCELNSEQIQRSEKITEDLLRIFFQGNHPHREQAWKKLALDFRKKYKFAFNPHQLEKGFLLSTVLTLLNLDFDINRLKKEKKLFEDSNIIETGFIRQIKIKSKVYHKFMTSEIQKCLAMASNGQGSHEISKMMSAKDSQNKIQEILNAHQRFKFYSDLSKYIEHSSHRSDLIKLTEKIYEHINYEPPSVFSHEITMRYLSQCLQKNKIQEYKKCINQASDLLIYWCGQDHMFLCDIYQSLSDFYAMQQNHEDCINFMKLALTTCVRSGGTHSRLAGIKYYMLGCKQMMFGFKNEAFQNLKKSRDNMETFETQNEEYPLVLNKLATLYLNKGDIDNSIALTVKALKKSQQLSIDDRILIKNYLLLCRAYQINRNTKQLQNLMGLCAKVFNNTEDAYAMDQMIRICLTCRILTLKQGKQEKFVQYIEQNRKKFIQEGSNSMQIKVSEALQNLMKKAHSCIVMKQFNKKLDIIERVVYELKSHRGQSSESREIQWIVDQVIIAVGVQFVEGILAQAVYF